MEQTIWSICLSQQNIICDKPYSNAMFVQLANFLDFFLWMSLLSRLVIYTLSTQFGKWSKFRKIFLGHKIFDKCSYFLYKMNFK